MPMPMPMRSIYSKKGYYQIYLHLYERDNPEIEGHLKFIEYLAVNDLAREEYAKLKKMILAKDDSHTKVAGTVITTYNLAKNNFIQKILAQTSFQGLCIRLCTPDSEWEIFYLIKQSVANNLLTNLSLSFEHSKHLVFYIIGAAQLDFAALQAQLVFLKITDNEEALQYLSYFLGKIKHWLLKHGIISLEVREPGRIIPIN